MACHVLHHVQNMPPFPHYSVRISSFRTTTDLALWDQAYRPSYLIRVAVLEEIPPTLPRNHCVRGTSGTLWSPSQSVVYMSAFTAYLSPQALHPCLRCYGIVSTKNWSKLDERFAELSLFEGLSKSLVTSLIPSRPIFHSVTQRTTVLNSSLQRRLKFFLLYKNDIELLTSHSRNTIKASASKPCNLIRCTHVLQCICWNAQRCNP